MVAKPKHRVLPVPIEIKPSNVAVGSVSDLDPDWFQIQSGQMRSMDPETDSESGFGSRSANEQQKYKKVKKFHVLK